MASNRSIYNQNHGRGEEVDDQANATQLDLFLSHPEMPPECISQIFRYQLRHCVKFIKQDIRYPFINSKLGGASSSKGSIQTCRAEIKKGPHAHQWSFIIIQVPGIKGVVSSRLPRLNLPYNSLTEMAPVSRGGGGTLIRGAGAGGGSLVIPSEHISNFPFRHTSDGLRPEERADQKVYMDYACLHKAMPPLDQNSLADGASAYLHDLYGEDYSPKEIAHQLTARSRDTLPGCAEGEFAHWVQGFGAKAIKSLIFGVGNHDLTFHPITGDFIYARDQVFGTRNNLLRDMINHFPNESKLIQYSAADRTFIVPTCLFFNSDADHCLAQAGISDSLYYELTPGDLGELLRRSHQDVVVVRSSDYQRLSPEHVKFSLQCSNIYLQSSEYAFMSQRQFHQLIPQVETKYVYWEKSDKIPIPIKTLSPVFEILISVLRSCSQADNNHYNFSGIFGRDPILSLALKNNDKVVCPETEGDVVRRINSYVYHQSRPMAFYYPLVFCEYPESPKPSGSQKLDNAILDLILQPGLTRSSGGVVIVLHILSWGVIHYSFDETGNRIVRLVKPLSSSS